MIEVIYRIFIKPSVLMVITGLLLFGVSVQGFIAPNEAVRMYIAKQWLAGVPLYTGIADTSQPAIFFVFAFFYSLFGKDILALRVMCIFAILAAQWFIYAIACRIHSKTSGLIAMAVFGIMMSLPDTGNGFTVRPDIFSMLFYLSALYIFMLSYSARKKSHYVICMISAGFLLACALAFSQMSVFSIAGITALYLSTRSNDKSPYAKLSADMLYVLGVCVIAVFCLLLMLKTQGTVLKDYIYWAWQSLYSLLPQSWYEWSKSFFFSFQRRNIAVLYPFVLLFIVVRNKLGWKLNVSGGVVMSFICELVAVAIWGLIFEFEFTRIVPLTALMAGMAVTFLIENKNSWDLREKTALVILLVFVIGIPYGLLGKKRNQSLSVSFKPDVYKDFGKWLTQQVPDDGFLFVYGNFDSQLYVYSDRRSPTRFIGKNLTAFPHTEDKIVADMETNRPQIIITPMIGDIPQWLDRFCCNGYKRILHNDSWIKRNFRIYRMENR